MEESSIQNLSRRERKRLKRQAKKEMLRKLRERESRNKKLKILGILVLVVALVGAGGLALTGMVSAGPRIEVSPDYYDFGNVYRSAGTVSTTMSVRNAGEDDLVISGMKSSCMCTTATLTVDGKESPVFGMHNNPGGWSASLAPGQEGILKIFYDPNVHKDLTGPVSRTVHIYTNDMLNSEKIIRIDVNQL